MEVSLLLKSLTLFRLDIVGVWQSNPLELGWKSRSMLFLIGGFNSYMERMFGLPLALIPLTKGFSSFLPLLVFLDAPCFFA